MNEMGKPLFLVVVDYPHVLESLRQILVEFGEISSAADGKTALKAAEQGCSLPDFDGYTVCRQLKAQTSTQAIPVIGFQSETAQP